MEHLRDVVEGVRFQRLQKKDRGKGWDLAPHVYARQEMAGKQLRETLWGGRVPRGPGWSDREVRLMWGSLASCFPGRFAMSYREMYEESHKLRASLVVEGCIPEEMFKVWTHEASVVDRALRYRLNDSLWDLARKLDRPVGTTFQQVSDKQIMWARQDLMEQVCPMCSADVAQGDTCGHGYGNPRYIRGKGFEVD